MLNLSRTLMNQTREIKFVPGCMVKEEGVPLVSLLVDGEEAVKSFEGTADIQAKAKFAGFSYAETLTPITANQALTTTTDADGQVLLPYEPITGQISVWTNVNGTRTRVENAKVVIDGDNAKLVKIGGDAPLANTPVEIVFKYMPTLQTAFFEHRVLIPSVSASAMTDSIGCIIEGEVFTDKIDLASDFDDRSNKLYINAEGNVAAAASVPATGIEIPGAKVIATPNGASGYTGTNGGFLGIRF